MNTNKQNILVPKPFGQRTTPHRRITQMCGTIVPIFTKEMLPGSEITQKIAIAVTLPPLASDTFMRVQYKVEAFFVPLRLCYAGFENWWTSKKSNYINNVDPAEFDAAYDYLPYGNAAIKLDSSDAGSLVLTPIFGESIPADAQKRIFFGKGTLSNYFGIKYTQNELNDGAFPLALYKYISYHLIWQHWYRSPLVQKECFSVPNYEHTEFFDAFSASVLPYLHFFSQRAQVINIVNEDVWKLADGCSLFQLRQRNYGFDYFTNGFPSDSQPSMNVEVVNGAFSIASLRASNSLQQWKELYQIAGNRMVDKCKTYGANLADGVAQRPIFLGSATYDVYTSGVTITANGVTSQAGGNQNLGANPFSGNAGGRVGNGFGSGSDFIIDHFKVNEPGVIMVMGTLVPKATYASGIPRDMLRYTKAGGSQDDLADYPSYMLQNTGNEPIYAYELCFADATDRNRVFGYSDKYADWFNDYSDAVGEFGAEGSLKSFVLSRVFDAHPAINSAFLEISPYDMDDITVATAAISQYGCWVDVDFDNRYKWPLYPHSMPSLQNPAYEHGRPVTLHRGGFRF